MYRIILPIIAVLTLIWVVLATIKRKIREKESVIWIILAILLIVISLLPRFLDNVATVLGISYPPSLLFALGFVFVFLICFRLSQEISLSRHREKELAQRISILIEKVNRLESLLSAKIEGQNKFKNCE